MTVLTATASCRYVLKAFGAYSDVRIMSYCIGRHLLYTGRNNRLRSHTKPRRILFISGIDFLLKVEGTFYSGSFVTGNVK
jgi:hypothetical protein